MTGSNASDFVPGGDNMINLGTNSLRWKLVRGVTITPGDLKFENDWVITENEKSDLPKSGLIFKSPAGKTIMILTEDGLYCDSVKPLSHFPNK